ncbi:similar to Saccharomyces cerevisiae YDR174W HMO1 Chromatin associated high mobility group (HMG) family member involved in genome maintenance [Maudiozyma saulgeensis]|uniref:Similar to Saccharomyces cerevisiae YDR174W HMO1 Chromatin associated high mobility group (HMG) family member involved in genome maintenance n=1 Tax=Maudiozyma saulgeensis TaxID=1789683 RepID=A0A1X7R6K1_9SACH|nr:similar to Saccharomyces cerevisiae YDR174W HMO1 Chromatin associated high mobility group (HMG) family member involved in genome maintenance [Kazachstania saulgeensis]
MTTNAAIKLKAAKDSLVASLFELSKASNQTASSIVDFYNHIGDDEDEKLEAFTTLTEALQNLTSATNSLNGISSELVNPGEDEKDGSAASPPTPVKAPAKKKAERDPNAPKKPLTVFFAYSAYVRQELRDARQRAGLAPLSSTEITQEISKKWKDLSDAEKDTWKKAYNVELEHYQKAKQEYLENKKNGTLPPASAGPKAAPVPIPFGLLQHDQYENKRPHDDDSSEKKKKKKKKDKKKDKSA